MVTFGTLQKSSFHVPQQVENLKRLADALQENYGATVGEPITESSITCTVAAGRNASKMAPYIVMRDCLKNSIISMGVATMDELNSFNQTGQATFLRSTA